MRRSAQAAGLCLLLLVPAAGCASLGASLARWLPDRGRECPGALVPTQRIEGEFRVRLRARVQADDLDWRLTLVAQKRGEALVLVGLDAFGAKAFALTQRGTEVAVERPRGRLPLPPINLLRDFHRMRFSAGGAASETGVTLSREPGGGVTIRHQRCGYRVTLVTFEEVPLPPASGSGP